jgi:hypothetical protein
LKLYDSKFLATGDEQCDQFAEKGQVANNHHVAAIKFSGMEGFRQLAFYFRDRLHVISGDLTGCIPHHHLVFSFGRVRLRTREAGRLAETNIAAKLTFQGSKIIKCQIRISWPLVFES